MTLCPVCKAFVKDLARHKRRRRCAAHGTGGMKKGVPHGTPDRRRGGAK
jgi:hypothetical protein